MLKVRPFRLSFVKQFQNLMTCWSVGCSKFIRGTDDQISSTSRLTVPLRDTSMLPGDCSSILLLELVERLILEDGERFRCI